MTRPSTDIDAFANLLRARRLCEPGVPIAVARAPGRLDAMGGIADYSGSLVLERPIAEAAIAAVQPAGDHVLELVSIGRPPLTIPLDDANRYLVNPGSVGQPRDGDPRAGFGIVDIAAKEMTIYRVEYPISKAQARIMEEGLPDVLAQRLALGR